MGARFDTAGTVPVSENEANDEVDRAGNWFRPCGRPRLPRRGVTLQELVPKIADRGELSPLPQVVRSPEGQDQGAGSN